MLIEKCRECGGKNISRILDLGEQPFANALLDEDELRTEKRYPLSISFCKDCSLVQLDYTADPKELFSNYFWITSSSTTAQEYANVFCKEALKRQPVEKNEYVLELASNDGTFLKPFIEQGKKVIGVDPAKNIAQIANDAGVETRAEFFGKEYAEKLLDEMGPAKIVFARNVFAHVANQHDFLDGISTISDDDTLVIIELHYSGSIVRELHYDSIYHEHLCYFTLKSLTGFLERHGLYPFDLIQNKISGGSLVLYSKKRKQEKTVTYEKLLSEEEKNEYNNLDNWEKFGKLSTEHAKSLKQALDNEKKQGRVVIGYGASARSSTMMNYAGINHLDVKAIIDQNKLKQGKYAPGTHIPIVSGEEAMDLNPDTILLLAWNLGDEIIETIKDKYKFKGRIIIPLPYPVKIIEV